MAGASEQQQQPQYQREVDATNLWPTIQQEVTEAADEFPLLADFYRRNILDHATFGNALAYILSERCLADKKDSRENILQWQEYVMNIYNQHPLLVEDAQRDLLCQLQGNASIKDHFTPLLYFGGFHALQCHRVAHHCWHNTNSRAIANYIQGQVTTTLGVDIHPAAKIGSGVFIDHAVAIVIGETAVIEDNVTIFQSVTLGGTGKGSGDRHPKIRQGAFLGCGNIEVGTGARIAAGAVVVKDVPPNATVVGQAAKQLKSG